MRRVLWRGRARGALWIRFFFAHPLISPICRTPLFPYLNVYSFFLAIGADGRVFVSDCARDRICVFKERDSNGTAGGPGGSSRAPGDAPAATTPSVTDPNGEGENIKKAREDVLAPYRFSYSIGGPGKKAGELADPRGITAHAGELWVADMGNHRVS